MRIKLILLSSCFFLLLSSLLSAQSAGSLDTTFNHVGWRKDGLPQYRELGRALALQPDGKIVLVGTGDSTLVAHGYMVRYNVNGSLDASFGAGGELRIRPGGNRAQLNDIVYLPSGKLLVAGTVRVNGNNDALLMRFNANGTLDATFGNLGGYRYYHLFGSEAINKLFVRPDGRILAVGTAASVTADSLFAGRFLADGQPDASYGSGGFALSEVSPTGESIFDAVLKTDGGIVLAVGGEVQGNYGTHLIQLDTAGQLDLTFAGSGNHDFGTAEPTEATAVMALQPDGKIIVAGGKDVGNGEYDPVVFRFLPNGSLDASFGTGGKVVLALNNSYELPGAIALQADGKILSVGINFAFTSARLYFSRQNVDGSLDLSFGTGGWVFNNINTDHILMSGLELMADGRMVAGGSMFPVNNTETADFFVARVHGDLILGTVTPMEAVALRVFPNPSMGRLQMAYALKRAGVVSARLMDVQGRTLNTLFDGVVRSAGVHEEGVDLERLGLSSGMYLLRIETEAGTESVRISYQAEQ